MVLLVNQFVTPVFLDVANSVAERERVVLFCGSIEKGRHDLHHNVVLQKSISYRRDNLFLRFATWLLFAIHLLLFLLIARKPRAILVVTNPPWAPFIAHLVSSWRNIPYHVLLYDLYPDALVQAGLSGGDTALVRIWARSNRRVFKYATTLITLSESMKKAAARYVCDVDKIIVIHNWCDTLYIKPLEKLSNPFITAHKLVNKTIVMYAGNMGLTHDLESLLIAAERLKEEPDLVFVFIGDGGKKKKLLEYVHQHSLENVLFLPYQTPQDFPQAVAAADIGVVTLGEGAEGISVPSKTYVSLAAGLCIVSIAPADSELARLVNFFDAGINIPPNQPVELAVSIKTLISNKQRLVEFQQNALKASKSFTTENATEYTNLIVGRAPESFGSIN